MLATANHVVHINAGDLHDALSRVRGAVSKEETRYYLQGVFMHAVAGALRFVTTDGHRLCVTTVKTDADNSALPGVILSAQFVADAIKATAKKRWHHHDCPLQVLASGVTLHPHEGEPIGGGPESKIEGTFPDYMRVMPQGTPAIGIVRMDREPLEKAIAAVTAFRAATSETPAIRLAFAPDGLTVSAETEGGSASVKVELKTTTVQGERVVSFNGRYLLDVFKTINGGIVAFDFFDAGGPNNWRGEGHADAHCVWTVMPMRI
jgi:DNA polymerase-3 subunit beta